jgi:hypothetical protein
MEHTVLGSRPPSRARQEAGAAGASPYLQKFLVEDSVR